MQLVEPRKHKDVNNGAQATQTLESDVTGAASLGAVEVVGSCAGVVEIDLAIGISILHAAGVDIRYSGASLPIGDHAQLP